MAPPVGDFWADRFAVLDPLRALEPSELGALYVEPPDSPASHIARQLDTWRRHARARGIAAPPPPKVLFCGARGSGKSTELRRLASVLSGDFEVLLLDLAPALPEETSTLHLLALFGLAILHRLRSTWEGADGGVNRLLSEVDPDSRYAAALRRLAGDDVVIDALVDAAGVLVAAVPGGTTVAKAVPSGWRFLRDAVQPVKALGLGPLGRRVAGDLVGEVQELVSQTSRLADALHGRSGKPVLVLADGLDKFTKLESVLAALADVGLIRELSCALVLSGPVNLRKDPRFTGMRQDLSVEVHFNVPIVDPEGEAREEGLRCIEEVFRRRAGAEASALVEPMALRLAAQWSSGMPREFLRLLQDAALDAEKRGSRRIERPDVEASGRRLRLTLQVPLTAAHIRLLGRVLETGEYTGADEEAFLLYENYIATYPNGDVFLRPHELLVKWVQAKAARAAQRADEPGD